MNIQGIGCLFSQGLGVDKLKDVLRNGWRKPADIDAPWIGGGKSPAYLVDPTPCRTDAVKKVRRSDA
jgi:hypothetical protein